MNSLAPLPPPWARARLAPAPSSCAAGRSPSLADLSMRDEEVVIYAQRGLLPHDIARALGHDLLDVMRALNRAWLLGIPTAYAVPAVRDGRRTAWN